ncbi:MAG: helix-turn-helix transcriptional regulator [Solirubrobacteraceae bacterium]
MLDQIRREIQARLEELLGDVDKLRRALAALTASEGDSARSDRAATESGAAGESVTTTTRRAPRTRAVSVPPRPPTPAPASPAAAPTRPRTAPGATKAAVLRALENGNAMTAGEIAAATGLARASVSTTLSKLASSGEIAKAARGYQLERESDSTRKPARPRSSAGTVATSPSPQAAEAPVAEAPVGEPEVEPPTAEPSAAEPQAAGESPAADPAPSAARRASGATRHAVLAALVGGSALTAGEVATATGLGRASVSSTLSELAKVGELRKAARGYQLAGVAAAQRFYFRIEDDATPRAVVANLPELEAAIAACDAGVLRHHCAEHDFSRWVAGVFENEPLAAEIAAAEAQLSADSPTETIEQTRLALITVLQARHATHR